MIGHDSISIVATVYNEAATIAAWLDALLDQSRLPDEIVIVDGGSNDDTLLMIHDRSRAATMPVITLVMPGANISQGRNLAIERAEGDIIVVTDAGTVADHAWVQRLTEPLLVGGADVASGFFVPRLMTLWERALAASTLPDAAEVEPERFLPSSRSMAFRRCWFDAGVRYPEWLDYCEDLIWVMAMRRAGARFEFVPNAFVTFAVRPTPLTFARQYMRYARGDGKAGLFTLRHALRYLTYGGLAIVAVRSRPKEVLVAIALGAGYVARPIARLRVRDRVLGHSRSETLLAMPLTVALRALGDGAKMLGFPFGLAWRVRRYGGLGWRTGWRRISPAGELFRPATSSRGSQRPEASPCVESRVGRR